MTLATFQDFEEYQDRSCYGDFRYIPIGGNPLLTIKENGEHGPRDYTHVKTTPQVKPPYDFSSPEFQSAYDAWKEAYLEELLENCAKSEPHPDPPPSLCSDVIFKALAFADGRNCDACDKPLTDEDGGPQVLSGCGHIVCSSCYGLSQGRLCNSVVSHAQLPSPNQEHVIQNSPMLTSMPMSIHPQSGK